ncbi:MAG TPA: hypothetical protein VNM14_13150 [Planctomycetota bacterium]|nr:hypothetical protein [Planctomycetota bacterium]
MEFEGNARVHEGRILEAMEAAEPSQAVAELARLTSDLESKGVNGVNLTGMWNSFRKLLHRRGYYVATPAQLAASLDEIETVGEGFDLFDLAASLARFDALRMNSRGLAGHRALPELKKFAPPCNCTRHRKET